MPASQTLPVDEVLPELLGHLRNERPVVLHAPTGAGKSTRVPPAIAAMRPQGLVIVVQPRRVAARAVARRIADEHGSPLGDFAGYRVRFDDRSSDLTRVLVVTDGILLRMMQHDPFLEGVAAICFDEFHERRVTTDLTLALARKLRLELRDDLLLCVMSATLDAEPVATWLDGAVIHSEGRSFPVEISYLPPSARVAEAMDVARAVGIALDEHKGDVLVFLPGVREIRAVDNALRGRVPSGTEVHQLFGDLPPEKQDAVFRPGSGRRVILSTNVAETSVTIPRIRVVVDSGLVKVARQDPRTSFNRLDTEPCSLAEADQRAGRAGRTAPGVAIRLWSQHENRSRAEFPSPEIQRTDLSELALELISWGEREPTSFGFFESPEHEALDDAVRLLERLELVSGGVPTPLGSAVRQLPLPVRLGAFAVHASRCEGTRRAAELAALVAERDILLRSFGDDVGNTGSESDVLDRLEALNGNKWTRHVHHGGRENVRRVGRSLQRSLRKIKDVDTARASSLNEAFALAWPDRIAMRREPGSMRALTTDGSGLMLHRSSSIHRSTFFVALEVHESNRPDHDPLCVLAHGLDEGELPVSIRERRTEYRFNDSAKRVEVLDVEAVGAIVLREQNAQSRDPSRITALLVDAAIQDLDRALNLREKDTATFVARWRAVNAWSADEEEPPLPRLDEPFWRRVLQSAAAGASSFAELRREDVSQHMFNAAGWHLREELEALAPTHLTVPSGDRVRIDYSAPQSPVLPVKIQQMFGATETPRVGKGRVPLTLHLLAPNRRPQQITQDLEGFWSNTYPEVRKELRQRYAKHPWPEDPLSAKPTAKTKKRM